MYTVSTISTRMFNRHTTRSFPGGMHKFTTKTMKKMAAILMQGAPMSNNGDAGLHANVPKVIAKVSTTAYSSEPGLSAICNTSLARCRYPWKWDRNTGNNTSGMTCAAKHMKKKNGHRMTLVDRVLSKSQLQLHHASQIRVTIINHATAAGTIAPQGMITRASTPPEPGEATILAPKMRSPTTGKLVTNSLLSCC